MEKEYGLQASPEEEEMSFRWRAASLEGKLSLLIGAVVILVIAMTAYLGNRISVRALERSLLEAGYETANALSVELQGGISDMQEIERLLASHREWNHQVKEISVFLPGADGILARYASTNERSFPSEEHRSAVAQNELVERKIEVGGSRYWSVAAPLQTTIGEETVLGCVGVWMSLQSANILRRQNRTRILITVPVSVILIVVLIRFIFTRLVHKPLKELEAAMADVESGHLDSTALVARPDELGFISNRFNQMLERLRETTKEREELLQRVNRFNDDLSLKVREATRELEEKNQELRRLSEELYYMQRRLARVERLNLAGQMAASFAHKMGTPLNLISAHTQTILQKMPERQVLLQKLHLIQSQVERLTTIFRSFLDETRKPSLDKKPLDLNSVLERLLATMETILISREVSVAKNLATGLSPVMGDESQLEQIFSNLLNNSLEAMPSGGTITVSSEESEGTIYLRFGDTGEGIPEAALNQIFRPLFTTKEIGHGSGLGLAIVKEILSGHGASIRAQSRVDRGTVFFLEFPVAEELPQAVSGS